MATFEVRDPRFRERAHRHFDGQAMMAHLGARLELVEPGRVEIAMPYDERLTQQHGHVHGGAMATIADSAAGFAAFTLMEADQQPLTVEYKLNILRPGRGELFVARGDVIRAGRTLTVVKAEVFARDGVDEQLCVTSIQTIIGLRGRPDAD